MPVFHVQLDPVKNDVLGEIGAGRRLVHVRYGRKWCFVTNVQTLTTVRVRKSVWAEIERHVTTLPAQLRPELQSKWHEDTIRAMVNGKRSDLERSQERLQLKPAELEQRLRVFAERLRRKSSAIINDEEHDDMTEEEKQEEAAVTETTDDRKVLHNKVVRHNELVREIIVAGGTGRERNYFTDEAEADACIGRLESTLKALKQGASAEAKQSGETPGLARLRKHPKAEEIRQTTLAEQKEALLEAAGAKKKPAASKKETGTVAKTTTAKKATAKKSTAAKTAKKAKATNGARVARGPWTNDEATVTIKNKDLVLRGSRADQLKILQKHPKIGSFIKAGGRRGFLRFLAKNKYVTISS